MAKKKATKQQKSSSEETPQNPTSEMEESTQENNENPVTVESEKEKISNLKSLNAMLLKKTVEYRQEISTLMESKKMVEAELTRSKSEVDVAKEVCSVFMESLVLEGLRREKEGVEKRLEELEREMREVVKERDEIEKAKFDGDLQIGVMKKRGNDLRNEVKREKDGYNQVVFERNELESELCVRVDEVGKLKERIGELEVSAKAVEEIGLLRDELGVVEMRCDDLRKEIEGLKGVIEAISKANEGLLKERDERAVRIGELEKEVNELNGVLMRGKEDVEAWRGRYSELDGRYAGIVAELEGVKNDFGDLMEEKNEKEREIKGLVGEKSRVEASLAELGEEIKSLKRFHEDVIGEKNLLQEVKQKQEGQIGDLQNELNEVQGKLSLLQDSNRDYLEKDKKLASEIDDLKRVLKQVSNERDDAKKNLDVEKKSGMALQVKVSEISKKMEETAKVIDDLRAASDTLVGEKKEIENKYSKLGDDKELIEKKLVAANGKIEELNALMKVKTEMFESALSMLKNSVKQLSMENVIKGEDQGVKLKERSINGEMEPIVAELEAMRSVFREREEKVGEIQQQMESLQMEVKKKKSFWTLVSSATTVLAAVISYAYASRVR